MDKIVGKRSDTVFLVQVSETRARVLNLDTKVFYPPLLLQSIVARGYWKPYTASAEVLKELAAQTVDATRTKPKKVS